MSEYQRPLFQDPFFNCYILLLCQISLRAAILITTFLRMILSFIWPSKQDNLKLNPKKKNALLIHPRFLGGSALDQLSHPDSVPPHLRVPSQSVKRLNSRPQFSKFSFCCKDFCTSRIQNCSASSRPLPQSQSQEVTVHCLVIILPLGS